MKQPDVTTGKVSRSKWVRALDAIGGAIVGYFIAISLLGDINPLVQGILRGEIQQTWLRLAAFVGIVLAAVGIGILLQLTALLLIVIGVVFILMAIGIVFLLLTLSERSIEITVLDFAQIGGLLAMAVAAFSLAHFVSREHAVSPSPYDLAIDIDEDSPHFGNLDKSHVAKTLWLVIINFVLGIFLVQIDRYYNIVGPQATDATSANRLTYTVLLVILMLLVLVVGSIGEFLTACLIGILIYWQYFFPPDGNTTSASVEAIKPIYLIIFASVVLAFVVFYAVRLKDRVIPSEFLTQYKRDPLLGLSIWAIVSAIYLVRPDSGAQLNQSPQGVVNPPGRILSDKTLVPWNPWHWWVFTFDFLFKEHRLINRAYNITPKAIRRLNVTAVISTILMSGVLIALTIAQNKAIETIVAVVTDPNVQAIAVLYWYGCWQFIFLILMFALCGMIIALVVWRGGWPERIVMFGFADIIISGTSFALIEDPITSNLVGGGVLLLLTFFFTWSKLRSLQYLVRVRLRRRGP